MTSRLRALALAVAAVGLAAGALSIAPLTATASPAPIADAASAQVPSPAGSTPNKALPVSKLGPLKQTKKLTRTYFTSDGTPTSSSNTVTVRINKHTSIEDGERIDVAWSGAHPTGGRTSNPFGSGGLEQEYPVMILECRGDATDVTPQTCWTDSSAERTESTAVDPTADDAVWLDDAANTSADDQRISGLTTKEAADLPSGECNYDTSLAAHITPFVAANGKVYYGCSDNDGIMPPEASPQEVAETPPNEIAAYTDSTGHGTAEFEVRTSDENASLGCSPTVQCSVVVIPIEGISCSSASQTQCNSTGNYAPGELNQQTRSAALAVSPALWWSASNWNNRFVFPVQIATPPSVCTLASADGAQVPFSGSELMDQAALQWAPAYCLNKKRFNWQEHPDTDDHAFQLMEQPTIAGLAPPALAAEVSNRKPGDDNVAYAPTALTGWGIAFDIDSPDGAQVNSLKLTPLLLAKLLTESYPGTTLGESDPHIYDPSDGEGNPESINLDPDFQKLNPGLDVLHPSEAAATLLTLSSSADAMESLTSYIASDPKAMAFIDGKPELEPDGSIMKVNSAYKGITLPRSSWPLLDNWFPAQSGSDCLNQNHAPYLAKVASPISISSGGLSQIATDMQFNWPNVSTLCVFDGEQGVFTIGRVAQQGIGSRFMLGLVDLGDAARDGLPVAELQAKPGHFVPATNAGIAAAVRLAKPGGTNKPFELSQATIRTSATAYPGTLPVYTAAKTSGLTKKQSTQVSRFIKISSTQGQQPGRGNGQLPAGYLPMKDSGATKPFFAAAQTAAHAIAAQKGRPATNPAVTPSQTSAPSTSPASTSPNGSSPSPGTPGGPSVPGSPADASTSPSVAPGASSPSAAPSGTPGAPGSPTDVATTSDPVTTTGALTSALGNWLLPMLMVGAVLAALGTVGGRIWLRMKGLK